MQNLMLAHTDATSHWHKIRWKISCSPLKMKFGSIGRISLVAFQNQTIQTLIIA